MQYINIGFKTLLNDDSICTPKITYMMFIIRDCGE